MTNDKFGVGVMLGGPQFEGLNVCRLLILIKSLFRGWRNDLTQEEPNRLALSR